MMKAGGVTLGLSILALIGTTVWEAPGARAQSVELQFYTSVPRNQTVPLIEKFSELNPDIHVSMFQAGNETLLDKMQLEIRGSGRIQADVMWIEEPAALAQFAKDGLLEPYSAKELDKILPAYRDPQGRFVANHVAHIFIMYNTSKVAAEQAPKSWKDLTDKRFANKLIFSNPRVSGAGATFASAMVQTYGWPFWESVAKLKPILAGGDATISSVVLGERTLAPVRDEDIAVALRRKQPIDYVVPAEGGLAMPTYVAIVKGTPKLEAARKLYDFMISKEVAESFLRLGMFHTRTDLPGPEGWPNIAEVRSLPFDWTKHAQTKADMKAKFSDIVEQ